MSRSRAAAALRVVLLGIVALASAVVAAGAQETVAISVPLAVSFPVTDVSRSTSGAPNVTTVSFSNASLSPGRALRVSVQPDAPGKPEAPRPEAPRAPAAGPAPALQQQQQEPQSKP